MNSKAVLLAVGVGALMLTMRRRGTDIFHGGDFQENGLSAGYIAALPPGANTAAQVATGPGTASPAFTQVGYWQYDGTGGMIRPDYIGVTGDGLFG